MLTCTCNAKILFYETSSGAKPVETFLDHLSSKQAIRIAEERKNDYFRRK